jgi:hypothetical protein
MNELRLFGGVINAPAFLPQEEIAKCLTYREAVRLSWAHRRDKGLLKRTLAERINSYAPHVTDYLNGDDLPKRRDLPAEKLAAWACAVGNFGVQQWLEMDAHRELLRQAQERQAA